MSESLSGRNMELQRWQDIILSDRPDLTDYDQAANARHRANNTLPTNNFDSYFLAELPQFENSMHFMGYNWRNAPLFAGTDTFAEVAMPYIKNYRDENPERWEAIQNAALLSREMRIDPQKMASTPAEEQQRVRDAADRVLTDAFLDLAPRLEANGIDPLNLLV